jgi:hypothetical protein
MITKNSTQGSFFNPPAQATLHTFISYVGKTINHPICVFLDYNTHNTVAVHSFLKVLIDYLKDMYPNLKKMFILLTVLLVSIKTIKISSIFFITKMIFSCMESGISSLQVMGKVRVMGLEERLKDYLEEQVCKVKPIFKLRCRYSIGVNITSEISNAFSCHQTTFP